MQNCYIIINFFLILTISITQLGIAPTPLLPYPEFTLVYFVVFVALISILLMNLLVGVAINNVNSVEDSAVLQRLSKQVRFDRVPSVSDYAVRGRLVCQKSRQ